MAAVPDAAGPDRRAPQYTCLDTHPWGRGGVRRCLLWIKAARRVACSPNPLPATSLRGFPSASSMAGLCAAPLPAESATRWSYCVLCHPHQMESLNLAQLLVTRNEKGVLRQGLTKPASELAMALCPMFILAPGQECWSRLGRLTF